MKNIAGIPIIISAPSGAGKTSLVAAAIKQVKNLEVSISHTTRKKRAGEEDGVNYHFTSEEAFLEKIANNEFIEHAKVFSHYYGTSKLWLEEELAKGKDIVLEIDWQGAAQVRKLFPQSISIFILPPSIEVLEHRLKTRGQDDSATIAARMDEARSEISHFNEFDYVVINDDFATALKQLIAIIQVNRQKTNRLIPQLKDQFKFL